MELLQSPNFLQNIESQGEKRDKDVVELHYSLHKKFTTKSIPNIVLNPVLLQTKSIDFK